jgi:hypothetical protein
MNETPDMHSLLITTDEIEAMRYWLADDVWLNMDEDIVFAMEPADVLAHVQANYEGGAPAFLATLHAELEV